MSAKKEFKRYYYPNVILSWKALNVNGRSDQTVFSADLGEFFIPVFKYREICEKEFPGVEIVEIETICEKQ